jgi:hypothetical protein
MANVRFYSGTRAQYDSLVSHNPLALYFCDDTGELFKGDLCLSDGIRIVPTRADLPECSCAADGIVYFIAETKSGFMVSPDRTEWLQTIYAPVTDAYAIPEEEMYTTVTTVGAVRDIEAKIYKRIEEVASGGTLSDLRPVDGTISIVDNKIGVQVSKAEGNLVAVKDDGLFVAVDLKPLDERLQAVESAIVGGVRYKGSVPTVDDLPTNPIQGDLYEIEANGSEYCWNGERWFEYGTSHFQPVTGAGIDINGSTISAKISTAKGNALTIADDNGLFVPKCGFTDKDRVIIDTLPMLYVTSDEMNNAISRAITDNALVWEELGTGIGVAKIGNTYYPTVQKALAAANDGDTVRIMPGDYEMIEFTKKTKSNITLLGESGVNIKKIRLMESTNYGAPYGLTLKNITFNGEGIAANNDNINNMSVVGCNFVNGAVIHIGSCVTNGLIVEKCEFEATNSAVNSKEKTAVLVQGTSKNVVIRDNKINDCEHNAIQVVGTSGSMLVDSNTINNTGSRAMRITTKDGAVLAIMNNTITNANTNPAEAEENAGEIIKITGSVVDGAIANNVYNGKELVFNGGIGRVI